MPSCTSFYTIESWRLKRLGAGPGRLWHVRLQIHLALASIPVLAISAHVFTSLSLRTVAFAVLLPLAVALATFVTRRPDRSDQVLLAGFIWGVVACAGYDAFRLPTIYACHWWSDFFGPVGGWATGTRSSFLVGYLWRYVGDGGGIAVAFFALAATLRAGRWQNRTVLAFAVSYAVFPVWTGLVLTDALASHPHQLFPLSLTTLHPEPRRSPHLRRPPRAWLLPHSQPGSSVANPPSALTRSPGRLPRRRPGAIARPLTSAQHQRRVIEAKSTHAPVTRDVLLPARPQSAARDPEKTQYAPQRSGRTACRGPAPRRRAAEYPRRLVIQRVPHGRNRQLVRC